MRLLFIVCIIVLVISINWLVGNFDVAFHEVQWLKYLHSKTTSSLYALIMSWTILNYLRMGYDIW